MRHTVKDPFSTRLALYINGKKSVGIVAVDTDAGVAYGYAIDEKGSLVRDGDGLVMAIYRGTMELRPDDQGFSDPGRLKEVEVFLRLWGKECGTPLADFEEFVKPWL